MKKLCVCGDEEIKFSVVVYISCPVVGWIWWRVCLCFSADSIPACFVFTRNFGGKNETSKWNEKMHACLSYWMGNEISRENRYPLGVFTTTTTACPPVCQSTDVCLPKNFRFFFFSLMKDNNKKIFSFVCKTHTTQRYFALAVAPVGGITTKWWRTG